MKVLTIADDNYDYVMNGLRWGLCEVLGPENVIDFKGAPIWHPSQKIGVTAPPYLYSYYPGTERAEALRSYESRVMGPAMRGEFEAVFIAFSYERSHSWKPVVDFLDGLPNQPKVAFINGDDGAGEYRFQEGLGDHIDFIFQREIDRVARYSYEAKPLFMSIPERFVVARETLAKDPFIDISYMGNESSPDRKEIVDHMELLRHVRFLIANCSCIPPEYYYWIIRNSKVVLCPPGAGWDCFRTYEVGAYGALPAFVHPAIVMQPGFYSESDAIFGQTMEEAILKARMIIKNGTWIDRRNRVLEATRNHHTCDQRAIYVLKTIGMI